MRYQGWRELAAAFLKLGAMSYGGPAIIAWRVSPLPAMAAGGAIGAMLKAR